MATATATRRKLVLKISVSLDGFVAGPNDEVDCSATDAGATFLCTAPAAVRRTSQNGRPVAFDDDADDRIRSTAGIKRVSDGGARLRGRDTSVLVARPQTP